MQLSTKALWNNWADETEHKGISNFVLHFVTSRCTTEHILMRSMLHFTNDTKYCRRVRIPADSCPGRYSDRYTTDRTPSGNTLMQLNEWALRNNEYPMPPFSDSRSDNRSFSPLTFGHLPKAQMPINPGNRGRTSSDLHPCQPPKRNWFNDGVAFSTPPPPYYTNMHT